MIRYVKGKVCRNWLEWIGHKETKNGSKLYPLGSLTAAICILLFLYSNIRPKFQNSQDANPEFHRSSSRHLLSETQNASTHSMFWEECELELSTQRAPWIAFYAVCILITFVALAIVCDDFFVPSLEVISEKLDLSEDVAGATFMAAGSSAPELFTSVAGVAVETDVGIGTIVGSAVFNILIIIALTAALAGQVLLLDWRPLVRDSFYYGMSVAFFIGFSWDGYFHWYEAAILLILYILYIVLMKFNEPLMDWMASWKFCCQHTSVTPEEEESTKQTEESTSHHRLSIAGGHARRLSIISGRSNVDGHHHEKHIFHHTHHGSISSNFIHNNHMCELHNMQKEMAPFEQSLTGDESPIRRPSTCRQCKLIQDANKYKVNSISPPGSMKRKSSLKSNSISLITKPDRKISLPPLTCTETKYIKTDKITNYEPTAKQLPNLSNGMSNKLSDMTIIEKDNDPAAQPLVHSNSPMSESSASLPSSPFHTTTATTSLSSPFPISDLDSQATKRLSIIHSIPGDEETTIVQQMSSNTEQLKKDESEEELIVEEIDAVIVCCPCLPPVKAAPPNKLETIGDKGGCWLWFKLVLKWILFIVSFPFAIMFTWTIPDCSKEHLRKWYIMSFMMSVLWIMALSFIIVIMVGRCGCILSIDQYTMGLVIIAIGTSIPDAISSILVARDGYGDMAVSNAIGSNVFDINLGLGLPFLISIMIREFKPVKLLDQTEQMIVDSGEMPFVPHAKFGFILLLILVICLLVFIAARFRLNKYISISFVTLYALFLTYAFIQETVCDKRC